MKLPIYLDNHSTTQVDPRVVEVMVPFFTEHYGNAASRQHQFGWYAEEAVEFTRKKIAQSINAEPKEIIFTSGATESNNLALKGIAETSSKKNHIITVATEHKSILDVCKKLETQGFSVTYLPVDKYGMVNPDVLKNAITEKTMLVSVMFANNEIGTIAPIKEIGKICSEREIIFHTDATQCVGKISVDVQEMNIHLMSFTAHKMYGPKGIGALYVRKKNPKINMIAQIDGGGHEQGMRSGTLNVPAIVGFGKAIEIATSEMQTEMQRIQTLRNELENSLLKLSDTFLNGHPKLRLPNNLNISFAGIAPNLLLQSLKKEIAISSFSACTSSTQTVETISHVLQAIGVKKELAQSTLRFGIGRFTTEEEIHYAINKVSEVVERLREECVV